MHECEWNCMGLVYMCEWTVNVCVHVCVCMHTKAYVSACDCFCLEFEAVY